MRVLVLEFETVLKTAELIKSANIAELLTEDDLAMIGSRVVLDYGKDLTSREDWEDRMAVAMELALQMMENKSFPWEGSSNVKFPLITIAALQFHSRAYPSLINGTEIVKCRVIGNDPDGKKKERAEKISAHMSYQVLEEDSEWEDQMDKVLITLPIIGCAFKKSYFDPNKGHNISQHVLAKDLVVPYFTKSLEGASRITHVMELSSNDVQSRISRGIYLDLERSTPADTGKTDRFKEASDNISGIKEASSKSEQVESNDPVFSLLEQHRYLDLDGDGYQEPYIVTVREDTKEVYRIVARYFKEDVQKNREGTIVYIEPTHYFTKYSFIPSPDGGFYDLGFGILLAPLNESINTLVNQLIDSGTMSNTAGGFLGRGVKIKGGEHSFKPLEWKRVESTGDDLRKNIFPLPVREPSQVLFTLLQLLINYGERVAGSTDVMVGINPGQNTPAETSRNTVEQGMKVFNGIFKRVYRALKLEFRKLYRLNKLYLSDNQEFEDFITGSSTQISYKDYIENASAIRPAADPDLTSDSARVSQANAIVQGSKMIPGFNMYEVGKRYLAAFKIRDIEALLPDPKGPDAIQPGIDPKLQIEQMRSQLKQAEMAQELQLAQIELTSEVELTQAKITKLRTEAIKALAEAGGIESGHQIALINAQLGAAKQHQEGLLKQIEIMQRVLQKGGTNGKKSVDRVEATGGNERSMESSGGDEAAMP